LKEGMAEVYSTFQTAGSTARIANPIPYHLQTLQHNRLMPLKELFSVVHDSPEYNETRRQGVFYAESWLLTHFLMAGGNGQYRARFGQFTTLLRQGQFSVPAFTNAFQTTLPVVQLELRRYLARGVFPPIDLSLSADVSAPIKLTTRPLTPVEIYFRLGDELLRVDQPAEAETHFLQAHKIAPASPLPDEGLGLLANQRGDHDTALRHLKSAIQLGSTSYLAYYLCALEEFKATADGEDRYTRIKAAQAAEIRGHLAQSIALMPSFGPSQQLCGVLEMVQGEHLAEAGQHLLAALQLEPENPSYVLSLAQYQYLTKNPTAARLTLEPLLRPNADQKFRSDAEKLAQENDRRHPPNP
jgi:tetratricopeptide (TPR) repeat protein